MRKTIFLLLTLGAFSQTRAQIFINKGKVEYEVRTNIKKTMGSGFWAELMKENTPDFKTGYYNLTFADNKSVFKFDHWDNTKLPTYLKATDEENVWYQMYDIVRRCGVPFRNYFFNGPPI